MIFSVDPNLAGAVYCTSIRKGDQNDWNFLWNIFRSSKYASQKLAILNGLGCSRNTTILQKYSLKKIFFLILLIGFLEITSLFI